MLVYRGSWYAWYYLLHRQLDRNHYEINGWMHRQGDCFYEQARGVLVHWLWVTAQALPTEDKEYLLHTTNILGWRRRFSRSGYGFDTRSGQVSRWGFSPNCKTCQVIWDTFVPGYHLTIIFIRLWTATVSDQSCVVHDCHQINNFNLKYMVKFLRIIF